MGDVKKEECNIEDAKTEDEVSLVRAFGSMTEAGDDDDDDMFSRELFASQESSLIAFDNLESVIKHIVLKFKTVEAQADGIESDMGIMQKNIGNCVQTLTLDDVTTELRSKCEGFAKSILMQKDNTSSLENQLDRTRVQCTALERKLEAIHQEKAVQDRLVRETQDALTDKVSVAELNLFEAKFAGYATKLEMQELLKSLGHYTRNDVTERVAESVRVLGTQFEDYTRTARVDQQLKELHDWVQDELGGYAKAGATQTKIDEIANMVRDQARAFERVHSMMDDKIRALSDRITSIYSELAEEVKLRAMEVELNIVKEELSKYALRQETDFFQADCVPKLKYCVEAIKAFDDRLMTQDQAIQRVDEILLDKAAKLDVNVMHQRIDKCFASEKAQHEFGAMYDRLNFMNDKIDQYLTNEEERMKKFQIPDYGPVFEQIRESLTLKADKADLVELYSLKANRIDADELSRLQERVHRQLEYLSVTAYGLAKLSLTEPRQGEAKTLRTQQKSQVLMQSEACWHWIIHNETPPNLDTLVRPPGASVGAVGVTSGEKGGAAPLAKSEPLVDKEKRMLDDKKRTLLEKKLGVTVW